MPGKRWTRTEKQLLKKQIADGIPAHNIVIENRTWNGIAYILRALRIFWSNRWTKAQISNSLCRQPFFITETYSRGPRYRHFDARLLRRGQSGGDSSRRNIAYCSD